MKYVLFVGDGMADLPIGKIGNKTPLEYLNCPNMAKLASLGKIGTALTVPKSVAPGTDTAFYSIMGYDVEEKYTGRSPLEAAGMGIDIKDDEVTFRCNLASITDETFEEATMLSHSSFSIDLEQGKQIIKWLLDQDEFKNALSFFNMKIVIGEGFRHIALMPEKQKYDFCKDFSVVPPHDIVGQKIVNYINPKTTNGQKLWELMKLSNTLLKTCPINLSRKEQGQNMANCIWLWGEGTKPSFKDMKQRFSIEDGGVISAVPLVNGIGRLCGLKSLYVENMTGDVHTNYQGKAKGTVEALLAGMDFVLVHVEAPDECSHDGNLEEKMTAIKNIDLMMKTIVDGLLGVDFRMMFLSDHLTCVETRTHDFGAVPYFIYDSHDNNQREIFFNESSARENGVEVMGYSLLDNFIIKK